MYHAPDREHGWRGSMVAARQTSRHAPDERAMQPIQRVITLEIVVSPPRFHTSRPRAGYTVVISCFPSSYTLFPISYSLHPISYFLLPTSYFLNPPPYFLFPTPYTLFPTPYLLLPKPSTLFPISYFLLPTPYSSRFVIMPTTAQQSADSCAFSFDMYSCLK